MAILIIGYTLPKEGYLYPQVEEFLFSHRHVRLTESSFAIETEDTPLTVRAKLLPLLHEDENLIVMHLNIDKLK